MARVFVSHASEDRALAGEVHRWLVEAGHEVFLDQDLRDGIAPGDEWEQRLHERLRWANAVLCVVTTAYRNSTWCAAEIGIARSRGSKLLPLRAEPGATHPLLTSVQHIDYPADPPTAQAAVIKALHRVDAVWPDDRSPFPGLRPFEVDQHRVFFGRADEVKHLAELLRSPAERAEGSALLVVGPSGCGKSSLVRAGLLPVMTDQPGWRTLPPILPGTDPVAALTRELAAAARQSDLDWTVEHVHHQLGRRGLTGLVDELLLADPAGPQQRLLIVVDQFEELLTQTSPTERARFTELLRPALTGPVRVVATLRPEFLDQLLLDPDLAALPTRTYTLRPLRREALRAVIEKPARLAGIQVDDGLTDRLVDDTASGEALPLLAFTLAQLAEGVTRGGQLSNARYDQLGGVQGTLARQADAALTDAVTTGGRSGEQVIAGLLRLVTVDEQGRPTRWRVPRGELPTGVVIELDAFVARRLLTTDEGNGSGVIGVAHEAFLSTWPPLAQAITAAASALRARRAVEHAATEWHDNNRLPARLWSGGQLAAAITDTGARVRTGTATTDTPLGRGPSRWLPQRHQVLITDRVDLSPKARDFLHTSIRRDRYRRRRTVTVLSVLLILALTAAGVAVVQQRKAEDQQVVATAGQQLATARQQLATARQLVAQAELARYTDLRTALQFGLAAHRIHPDGQTHASLVNTLTSTHYANSLTGHTDAVFSAGFTSDGNTLATGSGDGTVLLWDFTDPAQPQQLGPPLTVPGGAIEVALAPDGHTLAINSNNSRLILWDLTDLTQPRQLSTPTLTGHRSPAFSPDGHTLATASDDNTVILWDLTDPTQPRQLGPPLPSHDDPVAFASDENTLATSSGDGTVLLWDLTDPTQPRQLSPPLPSHTEQVFSVAFAPDGDTLAIGSKDRTVLLWDLTDPAQPRQLSPLLTSHTDRLSEMSFTSDGNTLATSGGDGTVLLWDLTDPAQPRQLGSPMAGHTGPVYAMAFTPDGKTLITGDGDGTMILWDLAISTQLGRLGSPLTGHTGPVYSMDFSPNGSILAAGSEQRGILWDLTNPTQPRQLNLPLTGHTGPVWSLRFAPQGNTAATASADNTIVLWDLTNANQPRQLSSLPTDHIGPVAFAPDGNTLATANWDNTVFLWDLTDPTQPTQLSPPLTGHTDQVFSVAFAPDGNTLATASADRTIILWDLTDPTQPGRLGSPLTGHTGPVFSVAFAPTGNTLATASADRTVILWDLTGINYLLSHAVERACTVPGGSLDHNEWGRRIPDLPYQDTCPT